MRFWILFLIVGIFFSLTSFSKQSYSPDDNPIFGFRRGDFQSWNVTGPESLNDFRILSSCIKSLSDDLFNNTIYSWDIIITSKNLGYFYNEIKNVRILIDYQARDKEIPQSYEIKVQLLDENAAVMIELSPQTSRTRGCRIGKDAIIKALDFAIQYAEENMKQDEKEKILIERFN